MRNLVNIRSKLKKNPEYRYDLSQTHHETMSAQTCKIKFVTDSQIFEIQHD